MSRRAVLVVTLLVALAGCGSVPKAQHYVNAAMPLFVTDDPVTAASGPIKAGEIIGRHKIKPASAVVLAGDVVGVTRPVPAGTLLAEGIMGSKTGPTKLFCDVRSVDAFSTTHETDCFEDNNADGNFDALWAGRPSLSTTLFTLSLSSAGYHGVIEPVGYTPAEPPVTEVGFMTYVCWNGQPAFLLVIRRLNGNWESGTGPCGVGDHPGEISKDGVFNVGRAKIKVTGQGDAAMFEVVERIPPGPIAFTTQRLP